MGLSIVIVVAIIGVTLGITYFAAKRNTSTDSHYVAEGQVGPVGNGLAISGDYVSAASFLGITGMIGIAGFSGFYYATAVPLAYLLVLLIIAEPLRNLGRFTLADAVAARFDGRGLRAALAVTTIVISAMYMVIQFVGAGLLVQMLLGIKFWVAVVVLGLLMVVYTMFGGMLATTWVQVLKTGLLISVTGLILFLVLAKYGPSPLQVTASLPSEMTSSQPQDTTTTFDIISQQLALALGVMGLPHVMVRFLTVKNAPAARKSGLVALWIFSLFYMVLPFLGYGAMRALGSGAIEEAHPQGNLAIVQLARALGGPVLEAVVIGVTLATILAVLAGVAIATSGAFAHDLYTHVIKKGKASSEQQLRVARLSLLAIAGVAMVVALGAKGFNLGFLANLAFAVAASTSLPVLILAIYWRGFNRVGATWALVGGLSVSLLLVAVSPNILGPTGLITSVDPIFPLTIPALVSIPIGFLLAYIGSRIGRSKPEAAGVDFEEIERRALIGR